MQLSSQKDPSGDLRNVVSAFLRCLKHKTTKWSESTSYMCVSDVVDGVERVVISDDLDSYDMEWLSDTNDGYRVFKEVSRICRQPWFHTRNRLIVQLKGQKKSSIAEAICSWVLCAIDYSYESLEMTLTRDRVKKLEVQKSEYKVLQELEPRSEVEEPNDVMLVKEECHESGDERLL